MVSNVKKKNDILEYIFLIAILVFVNIILSEHFFRLDFTQDKRYSISPVSQQVLGKLDGDVYVEIFLDGDLNPDYERLKKSIKEKLDQFKAYSNNKLEYRFINPADEADEQMRERGFRLIAQRGIKPKYFLEEKNGQKTEKLIFPGAIVSYRQNETPVQFLKGNKVQSDEEQLNQAVEGVEFELLKAIRKLSISEYKTIAIIDGHGEPAKEQLEDVTSTLNEFYSVQRIRLDSITALKHFDMAMVIGPKVAYSEKEKFILDQFINNGGKAMFIYDAIDIRKDSLKNGETFGLSKNLNLDDLLFKYGIRMNQSVVEDMNCAKTVVQTGLNGEVQALNFPYYPVIYQFNKHPIVKNMDAVVLRFAGSIDTVKAVGIKKTPLIQTSAQSKEVQVPFQIDLDVLKKDLDPASFNGGIKTVACLLEGSFTSLYKSKPAPVEYAVVVSGAKPSKVLVCADLDMIRNDYDVNRNMPVPLGYDRDMRYLFSNKEFILNAVDYMMEEELLLVREKEVVMRPLNEQKIKNDKKYWQIVNIVSPIILVLIYGISRYLWRKKKYGTPRNV
ncbi:protein involved in gliding motility GldG [Cytophaga hutchinsonii ATCC 33406]|uniref:Protein involved in gliding motility GldG n=1 Tax=Cytophaga hutchinsonii (strain ATCC 33406 / DSM 1761 / CIP 103989 / NBRC 15051 / NCIMB 9469 / D465) TaxID=269798 RepID=A0A6N4SR88_CYTH3|nr:protein involved in gliding motility GldG [Cytophaga hutchinsonii ATCC 33406]